MEGTLALADSLVVVGAPTVDGASRASKTLDWLIAHGYATEVANAVVVLSCDRMSKEVDTARVRGHFEARCRAVVEVPHEPHLATGRRIELARLHRDTTRRVPQARRASRRRLRRACAVAPGPDPNVRQGQVPSLS
jgi:MinD-like ATPase involved in chromosome partitioning or flagellar assembly